jgi:hypothetical protein
LAFSKPRYPRHSPLLLESARERVMASQSRRAAARSPSEDRDEEDDHGSVSLSSSSTTASYHDAQCTA